MQPIVGHPGAGTGCAHASDGRQSSSAAMKHLIVRDTMY